LSVLCFVEQKQLCCVLIETTVQFGVRKFSLPFCFQVIQQRIQLIKTLRMLQKILNNCCSLELSIHQRIITVLFLPFTIIGFTKIDTNLYECGRVI